MEKQFGQYSLSEALDGLLAGRDTPQSGIRDEVLRAEVRSHLDSLSEDEFRVTVSRIARGLFLSEDALSSGYGLEDVLHFAQFIYWDNLR